MTKNLVADAIELDHDDPFISLAHLFDMPLDEKGQTAIYLNGNSLGPKPKNIDAELQKECENWGRLGVRGHFHQAHPWIVYNERVTHSLARLVGAKPEEVVATGTLTTNLHATFISFYRPTPTRFKVLRLLGFPSDTYAIASQVKQRFETLREFMQVDPFNLDDAIIEIRPDAQGYIDLQAFKNVIAEHGESTAIVWIEAVHYLTGQYFNIAEITQLAHAAGCKMGVDLAHAIGNVPLALHDWGVDFAVWCSYKYLSAGPGAIAGLYVHEKHLTDPTMPRLAGWWGHNKLTRFQMPTTFDPIPTAESWQMSNSGIFLLAALQRALVVFDTVDYNALREKNQRLVAYLEQLIQTELPTDIQIITPKHPDERGCQLSLRLQHADKTISLEKIFYQQGIICDVRDDLVRVAPMGLYTTFLDVFRFVDKLKTICLEVKAS